MTSNLRGIMDGLRRKLIRRFVRVCGVFECVLVGVLSTYLYSLRTAVLLMVLCRSSVCVRVRFFYVICRQGNQWHCAVGDAVLLD